MKYTIKFVAVCVATPVMALGVAAPTAWADIVIHIQPDIHPNPGIVHNTVTVTSRAEHEGLAGPQINHKR
jgi:hypothetical protein